MPEHFIQSISALSSFAAQSIAAGGYSVIFIVVLLEGIPFLGSFLPGHVVIIIAGFLAKVGILSLPDVLVITILAAILGDFIGFYMGRHYGYAFLSKYGKYVFLKDDHLEKIKKLIDTHTNKAIVFGKLSPFTRPITPFLVGASGVRVRKFSILNIIGAIFWAGGSVLVGYVFGASYHAAAQFLGKFIVIAIIATIVIVWGYRFVNVRFHIFKKYELFVLGLNLVALLGLAKTIQDALSVHSFMTNFDIFVNLFMAQHVTHALAISALMISFVGSSVVTAAAGIIIGLHFLFKNKWRRGALMLLSVVSTGTAVLILKDIFMRARPLNALVHLTDPSFPSGHAALAAAFFTSLAYLYAPRIKSWVKRELFIVLCVILVVLIGLSRIVLNVHWASDVLAGWSLGIFLATASILLVRYVGAFFTKK